MATYGPHAYDPIPDVGFFATFQDDADTTLCNPHGVQWSAHPWKLVDNLVHAFAYPLVLRLAPFCLYPVSNQEPREGTAM